MGHRIMQEERDENSLKQELTHLIVDSVQPCELDAVQEQKMLDRVLHLVHQDTRQAGQQYLTVRGRQEDGWLSIAPKCDIKMLRREGLSSSFLLRVHPGGKLPEHIHEADEECLVLDGSLLLGEGIMLRAGDYHLAPKGLPHGPAVTKTGALIYIRSDKPAYSL